MIFKWITNCLLYLTFIYLTHTDAENDFRAVEGDAVCLPCHSPPEDSELVTVEWRKHSKHSSSTIICTRISNKTECIPRFKLNISSFTLSIENVQLSDSGNYSCKTTRIIPPPALDYTSNVTLQVAARPHLSLQKLNSSNETCVHLLCSLKSLTPVNFTWDREGHGSLYSFTTYDMNSELRLCKPDWSDGDTITCYANYSKTLYTNSSIRLTLDKNSYEDLRLLIIAFSAAAGLILCIIIIIITVVICKCRRKQGENGSIVFSNKVYENFSFAMARQNTQLHDKPQPEECIYEN